MVESITTIYEGATITADQKIMLSEKEWRNIGFRRCDAGMRYAAYTSVLTGTKWHRLTDRTIHGIITGMEGFDKKLMSVYDRFNNKDKKNLYVTDNIERTPKDVMLEGEEEYLEVMLPDPPHSSAQSDLDSIIIV